MWEKKEKRSETCPDRNTTTRVPSLWTPQTINHGQRSPVHIHLHEESLPGAGDQTEHLISVPPTDRRTVRMKQSMGRAVPPTLEQCATGQLGGPITHRPVCPQFMAKRDNK